VVWKIPSTAFSKIKRYFSSARRRSRRTSASLSSRSMALLSLARLSFMR
jgi:hypothetical protein